MKLRLALLVAAAAGGLASVQDMTNRSRIDKLVTRVAAVEGLSAAQITALAGLSTSQIDALAGFSASQLTAMATITASQYDLMGTTNQTFLAGLSKLPNQSDNNTTLSGVEGFCNNLSDNLQSHGFMSS